MPRFKILAILLLSLTFSFCVDEPEVVNTPMIGNYDPVILDPLQKVMTPEEYQKQCIREEWYFCDLNAQWRMKIVKDICADPEIVLEVGECQEFLECDPGNYFLETLPCITEDGLPGTQDKVCDKGKIQYTSCVTLCEEEVCDGEDNDCDDLIDEEQLNACGECGFLPKEVCDGVDNDCDGSTDEDLIQDCGTACGVGLEFCVAGNWVSCTAPPVQIEICDGFDNDCDGSIDEELTCECTINQVGTLFPCNESPLICGQGYKTCECLDPNCVDIVTTDCAALCVYVPDPDIDCDPTIGKALAFEECNNFDDNCNELIDEDLYAQCYTEDPDTLYVGICEPGEMMCYYGIWGNYKNGEPDFMPGFCKDEVTPQEEVCDGVDNDCDGITDSGEELNDTDILFIVDWSGSMDMEIYAVMAALNKFAGHYSDEQVIQWGMVFGPIKSAATLWYEHLKLYHNLTGFTDFLAAMAALNTNSYAMDGAKEMMIDAIYLSMYNLAGGAAPFPLSSLNWNSSKGVTSSVPTIDQFKINWRAESKRVIILFTDERPQSYFTEPLTTEHLIQTEASTTDLKIYVFTPEMWKDGYPSLPWTAWGPVADSSGGKWFELTSDMITMYNSLMEIIDENACK